MYFFKFLLLFFNLRDVFFLNDTNGGLFSFVAGKSMHNEQAGTQRPVFSMCYLEK